MDPTIALAFLGVWMEAVNVAANMPEAVAPIDVLTGCDGYNEKTLITLADNPKSWSDAWLAYKVGPVIGNGSIATTSSDAPPVVDFDHNFVVVVFGPAGSVSGYQVADSFKKNKEIHLRLRTTQLGQTGSAISLRVYPYGFFVFRRTKLPIDVEFPVTDSNGNESWQAVAKLTPPKPADGGQ